MTDTVLIVDDEESVRRTFQEWLASAGPDVRVFAVADAEAALLVARDHPIDLAVLDWNLESGSNGLQLLEDLVEFHPDLVAILVTAYHLLAHKTTYREPGADYYECRHADRVRHRAIQALERQGYRVTIEPAA